MIVIDEVFKKSLKRISARTVEGNDFLGSFYDLFMNSSEEISSMFSKTNMKRQGEMLRKSISELVLCYSEKEINGHLQQLGKLHSKPALNINPDLYDIWLSKLLEAVELHDAEFSPEVEVSWRMILSPGITYMKYAYNKPDLF